MRNRTACGSQSSVGVRKKWQLTMMARMIITHASTASIPLTRRC